MSSTTTTELFGIDEISIKVPSDIAGIIASGVEESRVVELAITGAMAPNANKIKSAFVKALEEQTGEKRNQKDGKTVESLAGYVTRLKEIFHDFDTKFRSLLESCASAHVFSFVRERSAVAEVKIPQRYITTVKFMFSNDKLEAALSKYAPSFDYGTLLDGDVLTESGAEEAAKLLREPLERREKELAAEKANI